MGLRRFIVYRLGHNMVDRHKEASREKVTRALDYLKSHEGNFVSCIWPTVSYHHERYDGKGYPEERGGEDIPDGARVIAMADSYDAMRSCRPYREAIKQNPREIILRAFCLLCGYALNLRR